MNKHEKQAQGDKPNNASLSNDQKKKHENSSNMLTDTRIQKYFGEIRKKIALPLSPSPSLNYFAKRNCVQCHSFRACLLIVHKKKKRLFLYNKNHKRDES